MRKRAGSASQIDSPYKCVAFHDDTTAGAARPTRRLTEGRAAQAGRAGGQLHAAFIQLAAPLVGRHGVVAAACSTNPRNVSSAIFAFNFLTYCNIIVARTWNCSGLFWGGRGESQAHGPAAGP